MARRFAARIGVVREAAGIVAYRAGHFSEALSDLRAARRMTGSEAYLPVMADCERGMGRPERALDLVRSPEAERLDRAGRIELTIVESGARRDLGQHDAAVITLQRLPELRDPQPRPWSARLAFAYADALEEAGHREAAVDWFGRAMAFDEDGETDAAERYSELTGSVIEDVEEGYDEDFVSPEGAESDVEAEAADEPGTGEASGPEAREAEPAAQASPPRAGETAGDGEQDPRAEETVGDGEQDGPRSPRAEEVRGEDGDTGPHAEEDRRDAGEAGPRAEEVHGDGAETGQHVEEDRRDAEETGSDAGQADAEPGASPAPIAPSFIEPDFGDERDDKSGDRPGKQSE
ncbi:hypothetical protein ACQEUU_23950 [Nonomuraea sp. CA-218870]|uniref:hypothetical protein n=1 Tax=Nonomuraea sp. CA-218870 TaxID=3239998 RepID=UPI003D93031E